MSGKSGTEPLKALELYCGIGGFAAATTGLPRWQVVAAVDINTLALAVYRQNFHHPTSAKSIESLSVDELEAFEADIWWASPPCQPFTRRGRRRDLEDPRAKTFLALLDKLAVVRPRYFAMENVVGFETSQAHDLLVRILQQGGYSCFQERVLCPSDFGVPNRRPRYYGLASREDLESDLRPSPKPRTLEGILAGKPDALATNAAGSDTAALALDSQVLRAYRGALHIVELKDPEAQTRCFTSAYGRSHVRSGSFLATPEGARRFSPREILALLSFAEDFVLPREMPLKNAWRLVGNSLSLEPVRFVLSAIP